MSVRVRVPRDLPTGGHIGPPLRGGGGVWEPTGIGAGRKPSPNGAGRSPPLTGDRRRSRRGEVTPPYGSTAGGAQHTGRCGHRPLRIEGEAAATTWGSGAQRSVCASGRKRWAGIGAGITPKGASNAGQSLSHGEAVTAPFAQGSLWGRGMRIARRPLRKVYRSPSNGPMWSSAPTKRSGNCRDLPGSALSAERVAGQIRVLPDD